MIDSEGGKLLVRVTGVLMFDTEHFLGRHLDRYNNWEIIHRNLKKRGWSLGYVAAIDSEGNDLDC